MSGRVDVLEAIKHVTDVKYDADNKKLCLFAGSEQIGTGVDATPFIRDGMLSGVEYDASSNALTFTWNTDAGETSDTVVLSDIIEPYTAGNGLELNGNEFSVNVVSDSEAFLSVDANGIKLSGVQAAINSAASTAKSEAISDAEGKIATAKQEAITSAVGTAASDATSKANTAEQNAKDYADGKFATKDYVGTIPSDEKYADISNVVAYINKKAEETLAAANGGSSETAASVAQALDTFKAEINPKVSKNTGDITTINEKLATIANNADVNVIEAIKVNGNEVTPENKVVSITVPTSFKDLTDDSGFDGRITAAQTTANDAAAAASNAQTTADSAKGIAEGNTNTINGLSTTVSGHTTTIGEHTTSIANLETFKNEHSALYEALKKTVDGHVTSIAGKAEQTALNDAITRITNAETAITTINETTIPAINVEIGKKADATNVYTKDEVVAITGTPATGKTLVQMIADAQTAATYDDTDVKANKAAIEKLNGDVNTVGSVDYKVAQEVAKIVNDNNDGNINTLNEIAAWIVSDTTGAAKMNADILANANAIKAIQDTTIPGVQSAATTYTDNAIAALADTYETKTNVAAIQKDLTDHKAAAEAKFGTIDSAIATLNGTVDTEGSVLAMIAATAPGIATASIAGLVKSSAAENCVAVAENGTMSVNSVNVNKLVQTEGESIILYGGTSGVATTE